MRRIFILIFLSFLIGVVTFIRPERLIQAQSSSDTDLINAVNSVRLNNSLTALEIDDALMASAQQQADYMAGVGQVTHNRADGSTLSSLGFLENIAGGSNLTVQVVVFSMWTDSTNWNTIVGYPFGKVGAGVAIKDDMVYYVLQVQEIQTGLAAQPTINYQITPDPNLVSDVMTATPQLDGSIIHEVLDGQSLWSIAIAYNVTIAEIIQWNNLLPTPVIFVGERLVVQIAPTPTLSPTITNTSIPSTRTITPSLTPITPQPSATITPTPSPTPKPPFSIYGMEKNLRQKIGWGMAIICLMGLIFVAFRGFIQK
ncbi:MAG: LysM peptidoglycan-binding domain-containing protein [Anaerolineaceae bacterium]|nr:LysM peptidoglycan-binding domain-containing protein [Anaerolineaceae bacterium]